MRSVFIKYPKRHGLVILLLLTFIDCSSRATSAAAGNSKLFEFGTGHSYQLTSSVVLNEPAERKGKDVGYQIQGDVQVGVVWQNGDERNDKLLEIELKAPKLLIKSRKTPTPEDFDVHKSELEKSKNFPFLLHWKNGRVINFYIEHTEETSIRNLKKGISSLFQFQILDLETRETDASGDCQVMYKTIDALSFSKTKTECSTSKGRPIRRNPDQILNANVTSSRTSTYRLSRDLSAIESVTTYDHHDVRMAIKKEIGGSVYATQHLILNDKKIQVSSLKASSLNEAIHEFEVSRKLKLFKHNLELESFSPNCDKEDCPSLPKLLKENREHLSASSLGTSKSATAFVRLLSAARTSTKDELAKAFKGTKNREILAQLCDLAGAIQLPESHEIMMKIINFDSDEDLDKSERYLWSLAVGSHPHEDVIKDILKRSQRTYSNEKLSETLVLTLAAMTHRFAKLPGNKNHPLLRKVTDFMTGELGMCENEDCKLKYLRALRNLKCPTTIPVLIEHSLNGKKKARVEAMKALRSFDRSLWSDDVIDAAQKIYFQAGRKYDSSSRTLALDILLESDVRPEILKEVVHSLVEYEPVYEVKQYLAQRIRQISEKDEKFSRLVKSVVDEFSHRFNNYNVRAPRGLTTAFSRDFANSQHRNGSLSTVLEISKGLLKRGMVDVIIETPDKTTSLFTLGLFAGGLSSFVSSDDDKDGTNEVDEEEDVATAGMELSVLGGQVRPFVFFSGQGELMGHVWSGTASEKTPAYQALILIIDHLEQIALQNGFLVEVDVLGGVSFDLSGQIQISLWNRNAHSLVEKRIPYVGKDPISIVMHTLEQNYHKAHRESILNSSGNSVLSNRDQNSFKLYVFSSAGISLQGRIRVDSSFVRNKIEFNFATEVKLDLQSDINFYSGTSLCMQLSQPEVIMRHNVHKIERIPGEKHRLRRSRYTQVTVPGRTYVLNRKNNEMCNLIFN